VTVNLLNGDCLHVLKELLDNSVDSCVTDPPYGLQFMGKKWDATVPKKEIWDEVYRVLKPGAFLLAFFGSRTYHRGVVEIEDAGFEIRDQIMWLYGSGFPKSHNVAIAIDKSNGKSSSRGKRFNSAGDRDRSNGGDKLRSDHPEYQPYYPSAEEAKPWQGFGTALKPAHEPIVLARKPLSEKTVAYNVLKWGTGAINIDGCRIPINPENDDPRLGGKGSWGTDKAAKKVYESGYTGQQIASFPLGRWPANVIHDGSDEVLAGFPESKSCNPPSTAKPEGTIFRGARSQDTIYPGDSGSAARFFYCAKTSKKDRDEGLHRRDPVKINTFQTANGTSGKPSSISEGRNTEYRNTHPTVKPTDLMRYLCRLVTPPKGTVLDPFMGSGSTGKAACLENFNFIGIELDPDYLEIARQRIDAAIGLDKFMTE
jgi:DNA modification methylase